MCRATDAKHWNRGDVDQSVHHVAVQPAVQRSNLRRRGHDQVTRMALRNLHDASRRIVAPDRRLRANDPLLTGLTCHNGEAAACSLHRVFVATLACRIAKRRCLTQQRSNLLRQHSQEQHLGPKRPRHAETGGYDGVLRLVIAEQNQQPRGTMRAQITVLDRPDRHDGFVSRPRPDAPSPVGVLRPN